MDRRPQLRRAMTLSEQLSTPDPADCGLLKIPGSSAGGGDDRRTLMEVICDDPDEDGDVAGGGGMINWKPLRDRLRLRRAGSAWPGPAPSSTTAAHNSNGGARTGADKEDEEMEEEEGEAPVRQMSLMALLEQADSQWGEEVGGGGIGNDGNSDDDEEGLVQACCVCMVRHKGAAFVPCGHTFCRLCSRELWATRRSCPLCNRFVEEILHIF